MALWAPLLAMTVIGINAGAYVAFSEIDTQLEIALMLGYVQAEQFEQCEAALVRVEQLVGGLKRSLSKAPSPSIHD
jgi:hypothetical protein